MENVVKLHNLTSKRYWVLNFLEPATDRTFAHNLLHYKSACENIAIVDAYDCLNGLPSRVYTRFYKGMYHSHIIKQGSDQVFLYLFDSVERKFVITDDRIDL